MAKVNKIEVQKGPIKADMTTRRTMTREQTNAEDQANDKGRRDGMILKLHKPKQ